LSQRGWGQFSVDELDIAAGRGSISLRNSIFVLEWSLSAREHVCYIFEGFVDGAVGFLLGDDAKSTRIACEETYCSAGHRHDHCRFDFAVKPEP
jgi:hypothetical protein